MVMQFNIVGKNNRQFTYKVKRINKVLVCFRNDTQIEPDEYNKALAYFNGTRKK